MRKKLLSSIKPLVKSLLAIGLVITLAFSNADGALAARTGGRIGGGSFSAPSRTYSSPRTYSPPSGGYYPGGGGYYPGGGGFGFPFLIPFWGIGGGFGGIFSILIFLAIANFLVQSFRRSGVSADELEYSNPTISIAQVQVGLLAEARNLQSELDELAQRADTGSAAGRAQVLQEVTLALLRHPEYWFYAGVQSQQAQLASAEAKFNQLSLAERSKFSAETLSNVNNQLTGSDSQSYLPADKQGGELALNEGPGEYIVVTLLVGTEGKVELPAINSSDELRQALRQIGGISSERLLAFEILWTPQAAGDTLTSDDILAEYPNLKLV